jgi:hypothetical protein
VCVCVCVWYKISDPSLRKLVSCGVRRRTKRTLREFAIVIIYSQARRTHAKELLSCLSHWGGVSLSIYLNIWGI